MKYNTFAICIYYGASSQIYTCFMNDNGDITLMEYNYDDYKCEQLVGINDVTYLCDENTLYCNCNADEGEDGDSDSCSTAK